MALLLKSHHLAERAFEAKTDLLHSHVVHCLMQSWNNIGQSATAALFCNKHSCIYINSFYKMQPNVPGTLALQSKLYVLLAPQGNTSHSTTFGSRQL